MLILVKKNVYLCGKIISENIIRKNADDVLLKAQRKVINYNNK